MIYICIPAFNEEQTVGVVLWKIRQVMAEYPRDYQLLVVDDASTDKTPEVLAPYARVLPLTVVRTESRQGESGALEMMLREAVRRSEYPKRDTIITLQADFTQEPDELVALIKRMEAGADIVTGETGSRPDDSFWTRLARRLALRVLGRGRVPAGVKDPFTGYRAYRVAVVKGALADSKGRLVHWGGWAGAAELLLATSPHARRIDAVELVERRERLQRPSRLRAWRALRDVWSLAREARPLQVASPAELDHAMRSVAAVRTSEVAVRSAARAERPEQAERGRRPERSRAGSDERRSREVRPPRGAPQGAGSAKPPRGERSSHAGSAERSHKGDGGRSGRGNRRTEEPRKTRAPASEPAAVEESPVAVAAENTGAVVPESSPERTRRKRPRRRKRGAGVATEGMPEAKAVATPASGSQDAPPAWEEPVASPTAVASLEVPHEGAAGEQNVTDAVAGEAGEPGEAAQRSRRRRRGRRGGRRRSGSGGVGQPGAEEGVEGGGETNAVTESSGHMRELDATERLAILELIEGDRTNDT